MLNYLLKLLAFLIFLSSAAANSYTLNIDNPTLTYVAIIANENYQVSTEQYTPDVTHAILSGEKFRELLIEKYDVPKYNISFYSNANATQIKLMATKLSHLASKEKNAEVLLYYTGKITTSKTLNSVYLIPPGVGVDNLKDAVNLEYFLKKAEERKVQKIQLLIDAEEIDLERKTSLMVDGGKPYEPGNITIYTDVSVRIAHQQKRELFANNTEAGSEEQSISSELITMDTIGPKLLISSHDIKNTYTVKEHSILIKGTVDDASGVFIVSINGKEAHLNEDNSFAARILLEPGLNKIVIQAIDVNRNLQSEYLTVFLEEETKAKNTIAPSETVRDLSTEESVYYALLMGVNEYQDPVMTNLEGPLHDVARVYEIITSQYTFKPQNVYVLENPKRTDIITRLDELERTLTPNDNLLIFFAGHGTWDEKVNKGYWLPSDAQYSNTSNWIRNSTISGYISGISTQHTLLIADACFSGGIFKTRSISEGPEPVQRVYNIPSKKAMTSGILSEVPDKSVFIEYLSKRLAENTEQYLSAEQLFYSLKPAVINNSNNIPQYGVIKNAGDEGGDFIFILRQKQ
jgi:hypothetical protein